MILYYSGMTSGNSLPERALVDVHPAIMLTFWEIHGNRGDTKRRFFKHLKRRKAALKKSKGKKS